MFLIIFTLCVCFYLIWSVVRLPNELEPPELSGKLPLIGHGHLFLVGVKNVYKSILKISAECTAKGGVTTMKIGPRTVYCVTDPDDCVTISNSCINKDHIYKVIKPLLGDGLITAQESTWKKHRKVLNPAFHQNILTSFIGIFNKQARVLTDQFDQKVGKPFDHDPLLRLNNMQTICMTSIGLEGEEYGHLQNRYIELLPISTSISTERFKKFWLQNDFILNFFPLKKKLVRVKTEIKQLSQKFINAKRAEIMKNKETVSEKDGSGKFKPFLSLILEITNETGCFTDEEIRDETDNIIVAGHDTSAAALTFALTLLGSYPDVQDKIHNEIMEVLQADIGRDLNKDDLSRLVYTEAVIKETLRLYPIVPLIARYADKPVKLKNYTIKANSGCYLLITGINRLPMWGHDVEEFRPDRWLDPSTLPDSTYFGVFGLGRRSCIGKAFAIMSMKITLAHIVRRYRIKSDASKMVLQWEITTKSVSGHNITLERRNFEH